MREGGADKCLVQRGGKEGAGRNDNLCWLSEPMEGDK